MAIKLGLIRGRHDMPVDGYILESVEDPGDLEGINKAVFKRMAEIFSPHMKEGTVCLPNALEYVDVPAYVSGEELDLYITGLTSVAIAAMQFCYQNGITVHPYHYDRETGLFKRQF